MIANAAPDLLNWTPRLLSERTCTRCGGSGIFALNGGVCFGCGGCGIMRRYEKTPAEVTAARTAAVQQERADAVVRRAERRAAYAAARPVLEAKVGRRVTFVELGAFIDSGQGPA